MGKTHRLLFSLLVLLLPVQLGYHFWPDWAYVWGIKIDYLSPTLYLTDLLVLGILVSWGWERLTFRLGTGFKIFCLKREINRKLLTLLAVFIFLFLNCFLAQKQGAAFYKLIKVIEFALLGLYVAKTKKNLFRTTYFLSLATIYSSLIAIAQFVKQASLGGFFYWLGERTFSVSAPGIAKAIIGGRLMLRPYATFSHPNSLAGFILVVLILILAMKSKTPRMVAKQRFRLLRGRGVATIGLLAIVLGAIATIVSFSRSAWLAGVLTAGWFGWNYLAKKTPRGWSQKLVFIPRSGILLVVLGTLGVLGYFGKNFSTSEAFSQRLSLAKAATVIIADYPLTGVGLNNFIVRLPEYWVSPGVVRFLQPVHNLFLLIGAETGLMGLAVFAWFLTLTLKKQLKIKNWKLIVPLLVILLLGMVDHYWFTLQQNQLLLAVVLGMSWRKKHRSLKS